MTGPIKALLKSVPLIPAVLLPKSPGGVDDWVESNPPKRPNSEIVTLPLRALAGKPVLPENGVNLVRIVNVTEVDVAVTMFPVSAVREVLAIAIFCRYNSFSS